MSPHRAPAHDLLSEPADAFSLFDTEEAVLGRSEVMLARLAEVGDGVRELAGAYRRSYHEQRRAGARSVGAMSTRSATA